MRKSQDDKIIKLQKVTNKCHRKLKRGSQMNSQRGAHRKLQRGGHRKAQRGSD